MNAGLRWILIVIGLLAGNVLAVVILVTSAGRADADRVLPDYYERAAAYDDQLAADRRSAGLGWGSQIAIADGVVTVRLTASDGTAVRGARVIALGFARTHAADKLDLGLVEDGAGTYRGRLPHPRAGIWELTIRADRGAEGYVTRQAVDAR